MYDCWVRLGCESSAWSSSPQKQPLFSRWNSNSCEDWRHFDLDHLIFSLGSYLKSKRPTCKSLLWLVEMSLKQRERAMYPGRKVGQLSPCPIILCESHPYFLILIYVLKKKAVFSNTDSFPFWGIITNCLLQSKDYLGKTPSTKDIREVSVLWNLSDQEESWWIQNLSALCRYSNWYHIA